jgi:transporter family-2 protein
MQRPGNLFGLIGGVNMYVALLAAALLVGCLLAVQTSVNLQLNAAVRTPYGASTLQLSVAAVLLAIVALVTGTIGAVSLVPEVTWWHLLAGVASPIYITSGILLFPRLGALAAVGLFVTGQMFASLGLDLFGLLDVPRRSVTVGTVVGSLVVLAGIAAIIRQRAPAAVPAPATKLADQSIGAMTMPVSATGRRVRNAAWIALGLVAGGVLPVQGAINANVRKELNAPITVGMISFIVASVSIALVLLILVALQHTSTPEFRSLRRMPWWGWLGGACAATYVVATFMLIPEIGAATTVALTVTGQQLFSAVIDSFGLFRMPRRPLTTRRIIGLVLLIAGSVLVQLA